MNGAENKQLSPWTSEVFLRPRAFANLVKEHQGAYRYCTLSTGDYGIYFPNGEAYSCEPRTADNAAEMDEVRAEVEMEVIAALRTLSREYERVARGG